MALSRLPEAVAHEIEELGRFEVRHTAVADQVILTAEVRGVPVVLYLDADSYPTEPPRLEIAREWLGTSRGRPIRGLECQEEWNRTLGIGALLHELEQRFAEDPPKRKSQRAGVIAQALRRLVEGLKSFARRLLGRRGAASETAAATSDAAIPDAIRARYREIIHEKTSRVERYREAVAQLMSQLQRKTARLEEEGREIQTLEREEEAKLAEAERLVGELKAEGQTLEQIKADARYQRCLAAYEELSAGTDEKQERFAELQADAEEHLAKIREHERRLETLMRELEELEDESAEVAADLATVQLEKEIADVRAGITRADTDAELEELLHQFRKAKAAVRITREAADLDDDARDTEYLEVARKVSAAKRFETSVGLGEAPERIGEGRTRD